MTDAVTFYGVHIHEGVPFLHQRNDGKGEDARGRGHESPLRVKNPLAPPHTVDLAPVFPGNPPPGFLNNPVVDFFLPKPELMSPPRLAYIICDPITDIPVLTKLAALGSATVGQVRMWSKGHESTIFNQLRATNLIPLTVVGWGARDTNMLHTMAATAFAGTRRFLAGVADDVPAPAGMEDLTEAFAAVRPVLADLSTEFLQGVGNWFFIREMESKYGYTPS